MKLVVGLGNPGRQYAGTRHNVGFDVLNLLAERHRLDWESAPADALIAKWRAASVLLAKPMTFVNLSGQAIGDLLRFYKIELPDLFVIVDDVNLERDRDPVREAVFAVEAAIEALAMLGGVEPLPLDPHAVRERTSPEVPLQARFVGAIERERLTLQRWQQRVRAAEIGSHRRIG